MATSPYKKFKSMNSGWIPYCNLSKLTKDRAYRILAIEETNHSQYGKGQQATIQDADGKKLRCQLPGKYLASLNGEDLDNIKRDVAGNNKPYLVFREVMVDNSYRIDIIEGCPENDELFKNKQPVPELETSLTEEVDGEDESTNKGDSDDPTQNKEDVIANVEKETN